MKEFLKNLLPRPPAALQGNEQESRKALIKSRPLHLAERRYVLMEDTGAVDALFERLRRDVFQVGLRRQPGQPAPYRAEHGRLPEKRTYFYLAPWDQSGWLFERSSSGWVVSQADKIVANNTFLRRYEPWDVVTIFEPQGDPDGLVRIASKRFGDELLSFPVYEEAVLRDLGMAPL